MNKFFKKIKKKIKRLPLIFKIPGTVSLLLVIASIVVVAVFGLKLDIDFTGGSVWDLEQKVEEKIDRGVIEETLNTAEIVDYKVNLINDDKNLQIKMPFIEEEKKSELFLKFTEKYPQLEETNFKKVGSVIGSDTKVKAVWAVIIALLAIVIYLAWSFRKVSESSTGFQNWHYGLAAIITLMHDLIIVLGIFAALQYVWDFTVGIYFLVVLLTILGYSVNDTIVVFNRLRENLLADREGSILKAMVTSIKQTYKRSVNTSLTTIFVLGALYIFSGFENEVIKYFSLALFIGIIIGTYSSIFIANLVLFFMNKRTS